jgi:hypothetical protein
MKKLIIATLGIFLMINITNAQSKYTEFKVGLLKPKAAEGGFYGGIQMGRAVDRNVGIGIQLDVYKKTYKKEETVSQGVENGLPVTTIQTTLEQNTWMFPLFFNFQYVGEISKGIDFKATAGLGYEFLYTKYVNFEDDKNKSYFFHGFAWHIDAGVSYQLSRASDLFGELTYHGGKPSRSEDNADGFPTRTEVDMSGIGFRIGLRIYNLGF